MFVYFKSMAHWKADMCACADGNLRPDRTLFKPGPDIFVWTVIIWFLLRTPKTFVESNMGKQNKQIQSYCMYNKMKLTSFSSKNAFFPFWLWSINSTVRRIRRLKMMSYLVTCEAHVTENNMDLFWNLWAVLSAD